MRKEYGSLAEFYRDFADESRIHITIENIDALIAKLKAEKDAEVIGLPGGGVVVQIPTPMSAKYLHQKKHNKENYTKLSVAIRKEDAVRFANACRKLGLKQAEVIMPVICEIISKADRRR
jgi:hypothetical protein